MTFYELLSRYDYLQEAFQYVIENNGESTFNPYHNLNHLMVVTEYAYKLGEEVLTPIELKELLLVTIFHDFKHTGGKENDAYNINLAKNGLTDILNYGSINKTDRVGILKLHSILLATQFPYVIDNADLTLQQQIIRDADLCQLFEPTRIQFNILGLQKELNLTYSDILEGQVKFVNGLKFNTKLGSEMWDFIKMEIVDELDTLIKVNYHYGNYFV